MQLKNYITLTYLLTISILFSVTLYCNAQSLVDPLTPANSLPVGPTGSNLVLSFSDEFEGTDALNTAKWVPQNSNRRDNPTGPDGWWSSDDSFKYDGNLIIQVKTIPNKNTDADAYDYSCGAILTKGKFEQLYGKYEIRCQLPKKQGWWVAFWMMQGAVNSTLNAGVDGSEVDIFEGFGWGSKINLAIHWDGYGTAHKNVTNQLYDSKYYEGYHTYTLEWNPTEYIFYIDGVKKWTTTGGGVCNQPGHLLVTGEISTVASMTGTGWANVPDPIYYPDYFYVDYVRVWKDKSTAIEPVSVANQNNLQVAVQGNKIHFNAASIITTLNVYDITGKAVTKCTPNESTHIIDLSQGIYVVETKHIQGGSCRRKFVVI
jgi:beta-glucanase (GH16 family)